MLVHEDSVVAKAPKLGAILAGFGGAISGVSAWTSNSWLGQTVWTCVTAICVFVLIAALVRIFAGFRSN